MSSQYLSSTPLAFRLRLIARAAQKNGLIDDQLADALVRTSSDLAAIESCDCAPASWKEAALAVAQVEAEFARAARSKKELARWRREGSVGLFTLTLVLSAFPMETHANRLGLFFEIDPDDGKFWVSHPDHCSSQEVRREGGETVQECLLRLSARLHAELQLGQDDAGSSTKH